MIHPKSIAPLWRAQHESRWLRWLKLSACSAAAVILSGCGTGNSGSRGSNETFFTSGSREADQRAGQRMAKAEQLRGSEEERDDSSVVAGNGDGTAGQSSPEGGKRTLYERLGGEPGVRRIIDDFTTRVLEDPRVNWQREGVKHGGFLSIFGGGKSVTWNASPEAVTKLKEHLMQFLALATGGPARYDGTNLEQVHASMEITNAEFDAAVGDLKSSLDKLQTPDREQRELLAIIESTRPQIVTER